MTISLGRRFPDGSSGAPGSSAGSAHGGAAYAGGDDGADVWLSIPPGQITTDAAGRERE